MTLAVHSNLLYGRDDWTRTSECESQSLMPYHLATPLCRVTDFISPTLAKVSVMRNMQTHIQRKDSVAPQIGLEPMTYGLEDRYSIHLSYWGILVLPVRIELTTPP